MGIYTDPFKEKFKYPMAICDGGAIGESEEHIMHVFKAENIPFVLEGNLYLREEYDLSQYKTIVFGTQDPGPHLSNELEEIFSFDKKNLELVVVLNWNAFMKVRELVEQLGIDCLGFRPQAFQFFEPFKVLPTERYW